MSCDSTPDGGFLKCAKIVGDTMGDYHPHGNQAIYDALARLAQDFAVRYPLIDGQGNFGNIDGDNPAAERYTEARITATAADLLDGIDEETVDFRPNYDGRKQEPVGAAGGVPQPARQRLVRHRRRHGDQHSRRTTSMSCARRCCTSSSIRTPPSRSWSR